MSSALLNELTANQTARRSRVLDAALQLASEGGYDAVQMREVAARADVALGTLYRYFSSKERLLVAAMDEQVTSMRQRLAERPPDGETPAERVIADLRRGTRWLQRAYFTESLEPFRTATNADPRAFCFDAQSLLKLS